MKWMQMCLLLTFLILTACSDNAAYRDQREATPDLMQYFHSDTCKKLKTVIEYGYDKVDRGHFTLLLPGWMKTDIKEDTSKKEVIDCTINLYSSLVDDLNDPHRVEKIDALLYLMIEIKYFQEPEIAELFQKAVCQDSLTHDILLTKSSYYLVNNHFPDASMHSGEIVKNVCLKTGE